MLKVALKTNLRLLLFIAGFISSQTAFADPNDDLIEAMQAASYENVHFTLNNGADDSLALFLALYYYKEYHNKRYDKPEESKKKKKEIFKIIRSLLILGTNPNTGKQFAITPLEYALGFDLGNDLAKLLQQYKAQLPDRKKLLRKKFSPEEADGQYPSPQMIHKGLIQFKNFLFKEEQENTTTTNKAENGTDKNPFRIIISSEKGASTLYHQQQHKDEKIFTKTK